MDIKQDKLDYIKYLLIDNPSFVPIVVDDTKTIDVKVYNIREYLDVKNNKIRDAIKVWISVPVDFIVQFYDMGRKYYEIDEFDFFLMNLSEDFSDDESKIEALNKLEDNLKSNNMDLFKSLAKSDIYIRDVNNNLLETIIDNCNFIIIHKGQEVFMYDLNNNFILDKKLYLEIREILSVVYLSSVTEDKYGVSGEKTLARIVQRLKEREERQKKIVAKIGNNNNIYKFVNSLINTAVNCANNGITYENSKNYTLFILLESGLKISKYILSQGFHTGKYNIDTSKLKQSDLECFNILK